MAFTLNLPTITDLLSFIFPMKIYEYGNADNVLPCSILEITENQSFNIPNEPIDDNTIINDTIYTMPKMLNVRVFVNTNDLTEFENSIKDLQFNSGFVIVGKDDQLYENYRLESIVTSQTSSVEGAYFYDLAFKEIKLVQSFSAGIDIKQTANASYSNNQNVGESANTEAKASVAKKLQKKSGANLSEAVDNFLKGSK